jgi:uncharacterized protein (TIGR00730 family)
MSTRNPIVNPQDNPGWQIPTPAHPYQRRQPLPWHEPKPVEEDPDALARIEAILNAPSYRLADEDTDFLRRDDVRGVRLQMDYLKAELLLLEHRIQHTIVVFGSTRICEPAPARRRVEALHTALAANTGNADLARRLAIAERILAKSHYYDVTRELGRIVSEANQSRHKDHIVILTGGGPGIMEAANRGAFDVGAKSIGLNVSLPHEQYPNPYVTAELCFNFHYFALRKLHFLLRAKALVAFPGGYGTFDELFEVLTLIQTRKIKPIPVVLVGESYWRRAVDMEFLVDEGVIDLEDRELFWFAETAQDIWDGILHWYRASGEPLHPAA